MRFKILGIALCVVPWYSSTMQVSKEAQLRTLKQFTVQDCAQYKAEEPTRVKNRKEQIARLTYALGECNVTLAKLALERGADIGAGTPLWHYCDALAANNMYGEEVTEEQHAFVGELIKQGARVTALPNADVTLSVANSNPIVYVLQFCTKPKCCVQQMVDAGVDLNAPALLPSAFVTGNPDAVKMLLAAGARADVPIDGGTYLHKVLEYDFKTELERYSVLDMLFEHGATLRPNKEGRTPLHVAVIRQNFGAVGYFLKQQTVNNEPDQDGNTALHLSIIACGVSQAFPPEGIVKQIIEAGVAVHIQNNAGDTPLNLAIKQGNVSVVDLLLSYTDVQLRGAYDVHDRTALHTVLELRYSGLEAQESTTVRHRIALALINSKIDVNTSNSEGLTPLHCAIQLGDLPSIKLLLAHGADVQRVDWRGRTSLELAQLKTNKEGINVENAQNILEYIIRTVAAQKEAHE